MSLSAIAVLAAIVAIAVGETLVYRIIKGTKSTFFPRVRAE